MESSITSDPIAYRAELERTITYNFEKMVHARKQPDNDELVAVFEHRMNNSLMGLHDLLGFVAVEHEATN